MRWLSLICAFMIASCNPVIAPAPQIEKPVIGVSGSSGSSKSVAAMMTLLRAQDVTPYFIGNHRESVAAYGVEEAVDRDLKRIDGIVILGSDDDIDPAKYGQARHKKTTVNPDSSRADYEELLIHKALENKVPMLAICAGMQRLNVAGGGSLHQHVPDLVGDNHHMQGEIPPFVPVQFVKMVPGSKLDSVAEEISGIYTPKPGQLPDGVVMENSFHHQSVDRVRPDFEISAISDDGIIAGIEPKHGSRYDDQFVAAVQFHPEFGASPMGARLTDSLKSAAQEYAREHPKQFSEGAEMMALKESAASSASQINSAFAKDPVKSNFSDWQSYVTQRKENNAQLQKANR